MSANTFFMWIAIFYATFCLITGQAFFATVGTMCACGFYSLENPKEDNEEDEE